jgi:hypothetical protein
MTDPKTRESAIYTECLAAEIQASINDPRPSISYDEVMAEINADIAWSVMMCSITSSASTPRRPEFDARAISVGQLSRRNHETPGSPSFVVP